MMEKYQFSNFRSSSRNIQDCIWKCSDTIL